MLPSFILQMKNLYIIIVLTLFFLFSESAFTQEITILHVDSTGLKNNYLNDFVLCVVHAADE